MRQLWALVGAVTMSSPVLADVQAKSWDDYYLGGEMSRVTLDPTSSQISSTNPHMLSLSIGQQVGEYFAVEARAGFGVSTNSVELFNADGSSLGKADVKVNYITSIYAKPQLPISPELKLYGLAGWAHGEISVGGIAEKDSDMSFGVGFNYSISDKTEVYFDWIELMDQDAVEVSSINLGIQYLF